jgi:Male gamete fusion factor
MAGTEILNAFIQELTSENNKTANLKTPLKISMSKSQVLAIYELVYLQNFNNKPMEKVVESNVFTCEADFYDSQPTCGYAINAANERILYSQGFCCKCSLLDILGLDKNDLTRGKICQTLNIGSGYFSFSSVLLKCDEYFVFFYPFYV